MEVVASFRTKNQVAVNAMNDSNLSNDPLQLQNSNYLGLNLVNASLTGENYLLWNRVIILTLRVKNKLSFITGKIEISLVDSLTFEKWGRVDINC